MANVPEVFGSFDAIPRQSCAQRTLVLPSDAPAVTIGVDARDFVRLKEVYPAIRDTGLRFQIVAKEGSLKLEYRVVVFPNPKAENKFKSICKRGIILLKMSELSTAVKQKVSDRYTVQQQASPWRDEPDMMIQALPDEFKGLSGIVQTRKSRSLSLPSGLSAAAIGIHEKDVLFVTRTIPELKPTGKKLAVGKTPQRTDTYEIFCYPNPPEVQNFDALAKHGVMAVNAGPVLTIEPAAVEPLTKTEAQKADFHLYLLIGQSNMAGRGEIRPIDRTTHLRVLTLNRDDRWVVAVEPIHFDKKIVGTGPGLAFGKAMAEQDRQTVIGLIPCAVGSTSISAWAQGEKLYDNAVRRTRLACRDGVLKGILWYQGEADVRKNDTAKQYPEKLDRLMNNLRNDLGQPSLPIVVCCIAETISMDPVNIKMVNDALFALPHKSPCTACITPDGLDHLADNLHFTAKAYEELGKRFAKAMIVLQEKHQNGSQ